MTGQPRHDACVVIKEEDAQHRGRPFESLNWVEGAIEWPAPLDGRHPFAGHDTEKKAHVEAPKSVFVRAALDFLRFLPDGRPNQSIGKVVVALLPFRSTLRFFSWPGRAIHV